MSHVIVDHYPWFLVAFLVFRKTKRLPYPPGPKGNLLIGNIRDLPTSFPWITYAAWSRQFSTSGVVKMQRFIVFCRVGCDPSRPCWLAIICRQLFRSCRGTFRKTIGYLFR